MTTPVTPPAVPSVPTYPQLGSPSFNSEAYAYGSAMPGVSTGIGALATNAFTNATSAEESATAALAAASTASNSALVAVGAANFKGNWSALTGALAMPASVRHNNRFWLLLNNLANVTTSQPGVSADWVPTLPNTTINTITDPGTSNFAVVPGTHYYVYTTSQIATLSAAPVVGDTVIFSSLISTGWTVARNGKRVSGTPEDITVNLGGAGLDIYTFGLRFVADTTAVGWLVI